MSDKIQIISILVSTLIAVISILIAIATLRQTNKITEEANRPYVVIYLDVIQVTSTFCYYLVVKNFGNTGAVIDSITFTPDFDTKYNYKPYEDFKNHFIAPNQSITTACDFSKPYKPITFTINYHKDKKKYSDSFIINPSATSGLILSKVTPSNSDSLEKVIAYSTQELIRTKL